MGFLRFLKRKWRLLLLFGSSFLLFLGSFFLYGLPLAAVVYPMGLVLLLGLCFLLWEYRGWRREWAALQELELRIAALEAELAEVRRQDAARMDYYTLWVHQIKTPIAAMALHLQGMDSELGRRLRMELGRIQQYADMVLAYLRLDAGSTDYVFRTQPLDPILRGAVRKFSAEFIGRKLTLDFVDTGVTVVTDEKWLAFVVEQLLSNALKYTHTGTVSLFVEAPCTLCVRDTGIGIAPEDLPRIFEPGFTGCNGRSDKKATGLGLYLCRQVCDRLGYPIYAESVPKAGTTIRVGLDKPVM